LFLKKRILAGKNIILQGKMVFAKLTFFPPNFFLLRKISLFQNTKTSFGGKKINLAKTIFACKILFFPAKICLSKKQEKFGGKKITLQMSEVLLKNSLVF
jgi:hypothetical protein